MSLGVEHVQRGGRRRRDHPRIVVRLSTRPGGSRDLAHALQLGELDFAILSVSGLPPRGLVVTRLESMPMGVLVPDDHGMARRDAVRWQCRVRSVEPAQTGTAVGAPRTLRRPRRLLSTHSVMCVAGCVMRSPWR
ncbi:LysR substrate-binding domain-containing protein [Streptomyces sp. NPDC051658]|uniref:LysR substrate-binding domain-containing protein n=1 Tax=Streptomyces sp. NPDC051658 TaxID=3365667 RepID=UPI0037B78794